MSSSFPRVFMKHSLTLPSHVTNWNAGAKSKQQNPDVGHDLWFLCASDKWTPIETYLETFLPHQPLKFCFHSSISAGNICKCKGYNTDWSMPLIGHDWPVICSNHNLLEKKDGCMEGWWNRKRKCGLFFAHSYTIMYFNHRPSLYPLADLALTYRQNSQMWSETV